jgi:hypothetical protein
MNAQSGWRSLRSVTYETPGTPDGEFAFLADPLGLLTGDQRDELRDDLAVLTKMRREVEADSASLRLA